MAEALGDWLAALALAGVDVGAPEGELAAAQLANWLFGERVNQGGEHGAIGCKNSART
jgi:hypothetical protein